MEKFFGWLFTCEHIFTLATVLLSGLISWWISAAYFKKGNRNALRLNVLFPMRRIISEQRSWKNYKILEDTSKAHDAKYLTKKERTALTAFLSAYKNVCSYNYSSVCAESLFSYFCYKLEQNGINTKPVPIEIDDESLIMRCRQICFIYETTFPKLLKIDLLNMIKKVVQLI